MTRHPGARSAPRRHYSRSQGEVLNVHQFASLADVHARLEAWRIDCNKHRPHSALGHLTPREFARRRGTTTDTEVVFSPRLGQVGHPF